MALVLVAAGNPVACGPASAATGDASKVIARYQAQIPQLMAEQGVPGLALALVDGDRVVWQQGFGSTGRRRQPGVGDTIFSVQSMSKVFTATAVMQAVQAGCLRSTRRSRRTCPASRSTAPSSHTPSGGSRCACC